MLARVADDQYAVVGIQLVEESSHLPSAGENAGVKIVHITPRERRVAAE
jgi:hypothetical protein